MGYVDRTQAAFGFSMQIECTCPCSSVHMEGDCSGIGCVHSQLTRTAQFTVFICLYFYHCLEFWSLCIWTTLITALKYFVIIVGITWNSFFKYLYLTA